MTSQVVNSLVKELELKFGNRSFITVCQLVDCGIYGSMSAARMALGNGRLPFVRISPRRFAIPRVALIAYLTKNFVKEE